MRNILLFALAGGFAMAALLCGCETMDVVGQGLSSAGVITPQQAQSISRSADAVAKTFQDITPEQEYYIGRSVAATILNRYKVYNHPEATAYINELGQTLARFSDKPETFGGYHFLIMDTDEINAFAAPGGLILISRGMVRCCQNEDELAAVLAHEVGHVEKNHGLQAIEKGRLSSALAILAVEAGKSLGGQQLADLTRAFEGSITDITTTLMNNGYSRAFEYQADNAAIVIMQRVGYDPVALIGMLEQMQKDLKPGGLDFAKTHPPPADRIREINKLIQTRSETAEPAARAARFKAAMSGV
jgi:predicted Zn-dependent protease